MRRLFVGIPLDTGRRSAIAREVLALRREFEAGGSGAGPVAWIPPENYHITLKFLGGTGEGLLPGIGDLLEKVAAATAPFSLTFTHLGTFGSRQSGVLWVGVARESIAGLNARLEEGFEKLGFAREAREFHPHLTIARNLSRSSGGFPPFSLPENVSRMSVNELVLFESVSRESGAGRGVRYEALSRFNLSVI